MYAYYVYDWDDEKRVANLRKHGVDFADVETFDWETATVIEDRRRDYGEARFVATGGIRGRLHLCAFTFRGEKRRIISLRKANERERKAYRDARTAD